MAIKKKGKVVGKIQGGKIQGDPYKSNLARIRKRFQATRSGSGEDKWFSVKAPQRGDKTKLIVRVLPPWGPSAEGIFYYTGALHYGFMIGGRRRAIACANSVEGKGECIICKFHAKLSNSRVKGHNKIADRIRASRRYWVNVIDRSEAEPKVRIFGANEKFIDELMEDEQIDVTDPKAGYDVTIIRTGSGFTTTRYKYRIARAPSPIGLATWKKDVYQLDKEVMDWLDPAAIKQALKDNYTEELAEVGMKFGKNSAAPVEDDDDDDDIEDEDVDDDADDEDVDNDDEGDDEDTDDDGEDEDTDDDEDGDDDEEDDEDVDDDDDTEDDD